MYVFDVALMYSSVPQNGQTYFKNLTAFAVRFLKCV